VTLSANEATTWLHQMLRIRRFEERCAELYGAGKIRGFLHLCIGEEAIAAAAVPELRADDHLLCTYREHGHALARGVPMRSVMAEMFGRLEGCSHGRGGSMHLFDVSRGFYGGNAIVAGALPVAAGFALADQLQGNDRVTACFFGEGAMAEGEFHETANLAALWHLPLLLMCENNLYAMGTSLARSESSTDLCAKARSYNMEAITVDGMNASAVSAATRHALAHARARKGPVFLELRTYRFRAHSMFDPELYRSKAEVDTWKQHDPIDTLAAHATSLGLALDRPTLEARIQAEINDAVAHADAGTLEPLQDLTRHVLAESTTDAGTPC
jgi:pyruvate dehydrogenase E1 component alpha subunit